MLGKSGQSTNCDPSLSLIQATKRHYKSSRTHPSLPKTLNEDAEEGQGGMWLGKVCDGGESQRLGRETSVWPLGLRVSHPSFRTIKLWHMPTHELTVVPLTLVVEHDVFWL